MKTKDVLNFGIDRNFLRKCIDAKVITPKEIDNIGITNKDYVPYDYSQEDVETVWHAYLCRKMGLSYKEINSLNKGEEIGIKNSMSELIRKYESQIAELEVIIEFMKYVKGFGFIPTPPNELMGSSDFKTYMINFIEYLDKDKKAKKFLNFADSVAEFENITEIDSIDLNPIEELYEESGMSSEDRDAYATAVLELKEKSHLNPSCDEVQEIVNKIFQHHKALEKNENLTAYEFAGTYILQFSSDSDLSAMYKKLFGEETLNFFVKALAVFISNQEKNSI